jgi:nicotinamide-nucleotide amidase
MNPQAELISIGNELLSGQTLNTHARDLGAALAEMGLPLVRDTTIPDDISTIGHAVETAFDRVPIVFVSGGLGPTVDDITRDALAVLLHRKIIPDTATLAKLSGWYEARGRVMTAAGERQALVLEGAAVLSNSVGAAPGQRIAWSADQTLFILPGPPNEFKAILTEEIMQWLREHFPLVRPKAVETLCTRGIGESDIVTLLEAAAFQPESVEMGFYPGNGRVLIRVSAESTHKRDVVAVAKILRGLLVDFLDPID